MVDRVILEIYLTCSLITEQMVVVSFLELYLRAGVPIILRDDCARPVWEESVANPLETLYYTPRVIILNFVALGHTVWA